MGQEEGIDLPGQKHTGNSWSACHHRKPSRAPFSTPVTINYTKSIRCYYKINCNIFWLLKQVQKQQCACYLSNKVADNTAIINAHARAIGVEDTCDPDLEMPTIFQT
jgi:hypothetical protein